TGRSPATSWWCCARQPRSCVPAARADEVRRCDGKPEVPADYEYRRVRVVISRAIACGHGAGGSKHGDVANGTVIPSRFASTGSPQLPTRGTVRCFRRAFGSERRGPRPPHVAPGRGPAVPAGKKHLPIRHFVTYYRFPQVLALSGGRTGA